MYTSVRTEKQRLVVSGLDRHIPDLCAPATYLSVKHKQDTTVLRLIAVDFTEWLSQSASNIKDTDKTWSSRVFRPIYYLYVACFLSLTKWWPYGTNVYDHDWDALIILDACRVDALREVSEEYDFVSVDETINSVGSTSFEWMNHTFDTDYREEIERTAYVSGNGYTDRVLGHGGETGHAAMPFGPSEYDVVDPEDFAYLEELWRAEFDNSSEWMIDGNAGSWVHPKYTTDRAIEAGRERSSDRLLVHYMYPHDPFPLADSDDLVRPFDSLRSRDVTRAEAYREYLDHLRLVLDEVERLLENLNAEDVVITADHGEAFGEYGFYRHVIGCPLPCMREVPWVKTTAEDTGMYDPEAPEPESETDSVDVESRLENLGYL